MYENKEQEVAIKKLKADAMNKTDFDREISIMLVSIIYIKRKKLCFKRFVF